jgi:uncharacterized protein
VTAHPPAARSAAWAATVVLALLLAVCAWVVPARAADPTFPALTGRVVDQARILSLETIAGLDAKLAQLEADTGDQFVVVTLDSLQGYEIEDFGYRLGRAWGVGARENDSGVLLIVAPNERKVRLEVGYGLEPVLTDALSNHIIQTDILPPFREGGYARGINAGVDSVIAQLRLDPAEAEARAAAAEPSRVEIPGPAILVIALVLGFLVLSFLRAAGRGGRRRRARGGVDPILVWGAAEILSGLARGGRSGGGWSSGGGGGFSGGGGSFGGGGASGGW